MLVGGVEGGDDETTSSGADLRARRAGHHGRRLGTVLESRGTPVGSGLHFPELEWRTESPLITAGE